MDNPAELAWFLLGPTAAGKSALAVDLARRRGDLEIISLDSMQIYRDLPVTTQVVPPAERGGVPHHLMEEIDPRESFHAARYLARVQEVLAGIQARGRRPLFVGGTGLYYKALTSGLSPVPAGAREIRGGLAGDLAREGPGALWERLRALDPERAAQIQPRDARRIVRALEIHALIQRPPSELFAEPKDVMVTRFAAVAVHRPREALYRRIDARLDRSWDAMIAEVSGYLDRIGDQRPTACQALGITLIDRVRRGDLAPGAALDLLKRDTRRFAKRQVTLFRQDPRIRWLLTPEETGSGSLTERLEQILTGADPGDPPP